jgi:hypothetical protein
LLGTFRLQFSFQDDLATLYRIGHRLPYFIHGQYKPLEGMDNGRESVVLSAITEAAAWRHALENTSDPNYLRGGQRIIVSPKFLSKFATVMTTSNVGLDMDGGHDIAYERVLAECQTWGADCKPLFLPEDS